MSTSAERMRAHRGHKGGDHSECNYHRCKYRRDLEYQNEAHLLALAVFDALNDAGMDAREFFGDNYDEMRQLADAESPDYLDDEPDSVQRMQARRAVSDAMGNS